MSTSSSSQAMPFSAISNRTGRAAVDTGCMYSFIGDLPGWWQARDSDIPPARLPVKPATPGPRLLLLQRDAGSVSSARAADTATTMHAAAAQIEAIDRRLVIRPARQRAHEEHLVEDQL